MTTQAIPSFYVTEEEHHPEGGSTMLGFWIYLMSDCLIFACLFATYAVLGRNYAGGPSGAEIFELPTVALNTAFLLFSSITYGFAMLAAQKKNVKGTLVWLAITESSPRFMPARSASARSAASACATTARASARKTRPSSVKRMRRPTR